METIRQQIMHILREGPISAIELSGELGISEREVYEHLPHIAKTVKAHDEKLIIQPAQCLQCGFIFSGRTRFTRPGHCPQCKESRISRPCYEIQKRD